MRMKPQASRRDLRRDAMSILAAGTLARSSGFGGPNSPEQRERLIAALAAYDASAPPRSTPWPNSAREETRLAAKAEHRVVMIARRRAYATLAKVMRQTPGTAQSAAYKARLTDMLVPGRTLHCVVCGKAFEATRRDAMTCSVRCRRLKAKRGALDPALRGIGLA